MKEGAALKTSPDADLERPAADDDLRRPDAKASQDWLEETKHNTRATKQTHAIKSPPPAHRERATSLMAIAECRRRQARG
jgi:hypothetical protein